MSEHAIEVILNGEPVQAIVEGRRTLVDFIRLDAGKTGTHIGCEHGVCGACTVMLDGEAVRACLMLAVQADGRQVRTLEGVAADDGTFSRVQQAMREEHGLQCGFCTPGVVMTLTAMTEANPQVSEEELTDAICGHLCRCTGYQGILRVVKRLTGAAT